MFPWLAHGHIFPYLELSRRLLIRKNFHIYLCSTPINSTSINTFIHNNNLSESIEVVQLHLQPSHELPPHYHTTKNLPSHLAFTLIKAFQTAESSFSDIITTLKPDLVILDASNLRLPDLLLHKVFLLLTLPLLEQPRARIPITTAFFVIPTTTFRFKNCVLPMID
ncbi:UNVERIFIED_CONTAM: UDP-glucosyltransferase 29 [Sesamum calycinum]|uniref:UDP-glucosyltransferase 29 n=1 Tax=Sesamum calycinum TaxID=2727403 RepID=A0AAW2QKB0_9LAMI